jgi:pyruvate dehydrogenase E2 component (dihydrolipoamide acetyltransferase)
MPKFGLAMTEGKVALWAKPEGANISVGDELADIETTKITNAYESPVQGILRRHVAPEGEELPVGALIAVVAGAETPDAEIDAFIAQFQESFTSEGGGADAPDAPEPQMIQAGNWAIRYLESGEASDAPPVVLIHGFGGDLNNWLFTQPSLSEERRVIALDLPGHGGSAKQVGAGDVATLSAAVRAALQALDVSSAHLVGHSLGGAVAVQAALDQPGLAASLTLLAPAGFGETINGGFIEGFIAASRRKQLQPVLEQLFADPALVSRDMAEEVLRFKRLDGVEQALRAIASANFEGDRQRFDLRGSFARLGTTPVTIIWGEADAILPVSGAEGLPAAWSVHRLAGVGHMAHMERATQVNRMILDQSGG